MVEWDRALWYPIARGDGREFRTLREAADYIQALPKTEQNLPHWQAAIAAMLLNVEPGADNTLAAMTLRRALDHGQPPPPKAPRRKARRKATIITGRK